MSTVKFRLKQPNSKEDTLIYLFFNFNYFEVDDKGKKIYIPLKYSTGETINPDYWSSTKQRAKATKEFPEHPEFNQRLNDLESAIKNIYRKQVNDNVRPTPETLKTELDLFLKKKIDPKDISFFRFVEDFLTKTNKKHNTVRNYKTTFNHLQNFQKEYNRKIDFDSFDLDFYEEFNQFLKASHCGLNTIGTHVKNIKVFLNEATERGLNKRFDFRSKRFKTLSEEVDNIYLTENELTVLYNLDLKNKRLEKVRDLFIIGCYTGLRFSDFSKLQAENVFSNEKGSFIKIRTTKTDELVVIPLHWRIEEIFKKYENKIPQPISNQKMNDYLKEIGKKAELNESVLLSQTKGGQKVCEKVAKCELITTHTARRSFATNLYLKGVPSISIMKITGHRTERAFLRYIKMSAEDNANKLIDAGFFTKQPLLNE